MSLFNKFKHNYNIKLLNEYISANNHDEIINLLKKLKSNNSDLFFLLMNYLNKNYSNIPSGDSLFPNKYTLVNSFLDEDQKYIIDFLIFYFQKNNFRTNIQSLSDSVSNDLESLNISALPNQISFEEMVLYSDFFLNSLLLNTDDKDLFLSSNAAFFEGKDSKYFIYPQRTRAFIFIHNHPYKIYSQLRNKYNNQQQALNELFNFENSLISNQKNKSSIQVLENRQSWNIHTSSWLDPNVVSSYNGFILDMKDLIDNPTDALTNLIFHLKQSGLQIDINYETIESYCMINKIDEIQLEISNKEKKLISNHLDLKVIEELKYTI